MSFKMLTVRINEILYDHIKERCGLEGLTIQGFVTNAAYRYLDYLEAEEGKMKKAGKGRFRIEKALKKQKN